MPQHLVDGLDHLGGGLDLDSVTDHLDQGCGQFFTGGSAQHVGTGDLGGIVTDTVRAAHDTGDGAECWTWFCLAGRWIVGQACAIMAERGWDRMVRVYRREKDFAVLESAFITL